MTIEEAYKRDAREKAEKKAAQKRIQARHAQHDERVKEFLDGAAIIATAVTVGIMLFLG